MEFTFVHAADVHLGAAFYGLAHRNPDAAEAFLSAPERALGRLVDLALAQRAAFVVIAGDLFDGAWKEQRAGFDAARSLAPLMRAGVRLFLVKGNHDAQSEVAARLALGEGAHVFGHAGPETVTLDALGVAVHGWSFRDRAEKANRALDYPAAVPGRFNLGVLHTSCAGATDGQEGAYAPCTPTDLRRKGYDYWALGHVHTRAVLSEAPWIVYPGALQGRSPREVGPKGAMVVRVADGRVVEARFEPCDVARFALETVALETVQDDDGLDRALSAALGRALETGEGRPVAVRLRLEGASALDAALRAQSATELLRRASSLAAALSDRLHLEKVELASTPATTAADLGADALATLLADVAAAPETRAALAADLEKVARQAPADLDLADETEAWLAAGAARLTLGARGR